MTRLLDISALSELLSISTGSIRNALWRSEIGTAIPPPIRLGRRLRWETSTVERWLQEKALQSNPSGNRSSITDRHIGRPTRRSQLARMRSPSSVPQIAAPGDQDSRSNTGGTHETPSTPEGHAL